MTRYTKQQVKEIRQAKDLSVKDRKAYLELLAEKFGKSFHAIEQKFNVLHRGRRRNKKAELDGNIEYVPRTKRQVVNRVKFDSGPVVNLPYKSISIDTENKTLRIEL